MTHFELIGDPPIRVHVRRSGRARQMSLRVSRLDGKVTLTLPQRAPLKPAQAFVREKEKWLRRHLGDLNPVTLVDEGATLPIEGKPTSVVRGPRNEWRPEDAELVISTRVSKVPAAARAYLKGLAREKLARASDKHADILGRTYSRLTLRDTRSRWGSCSADGALMYSWRLILAPAEVLDYVAAHEVAHLAEMNHGPEFWATVERLCPDFAVHRGWLREHGETLHRYRFESR